MNSDLDMRLGVSAKRCAQDVSSQHLPNAVCANKMSLCRIEQFRKRRKTDTTLEIEIDVADTRKDEQRSWQTSNATCRGFATDRYCPRTHRTTHQSRQTEERDFSALTSLLLLKRLAKIAALHLSQVVKA